MKRKTFLAVIATMIAAITATSASAATPPLLGDWNFASGSGADQSGNWSTFTPHGNAYFSNGLVVSGTGDGPYAATGWANASGYSGPTIADKTLVSWVRIDNPAVLSGSPLSVWKPGSYPHYVFDAIDYGESPWLPDQWIAGSDMFLRTQQFVPGAVDSGGVTRQVAISYQSNGNGTETVTGCLDGNLLGSYTTANNATFASGEQPQALFGPRSRVTALGDAPGGSIDAHIMQSQIYGGAMTCQQVAQLSLPTTTAQCKNGGWQQYSVFKNQGDCVSYVATKGKNAAG